MMPILMDDTKPLTELATDQTNGLGRLDCLKAECNQVANGVFVVTLVYPVSGKHFKDLHHNGIFKAKVDDTSDLQLFRIKKISKPMNGKIEIQAQHITYDLSKTSVLPFTATGAQAACAGIKSHLVNAELYPFDLVSDSTNSTSRFNLQKPQSFRACLGGVSGSLLDLFGGEYEWDNLTVRHHVHRGQDNGVRISYGKNLTDVKQEESIENMYTAVMPYVVQQNGESSTTILGDLQTITQSDQPRVLNLDLSEYFDQNAEVTVEDINARCQAYIKASNLNKPTVSIDVSFVALWQTEQYKNIAPLERVNLFDTVHVNFEPLGIETTARVTEYTYDILKERYISIHLGNVRSSLAKTIAQTQDQITKETERAIGFLETAIKKNTDMMTGVSGGHKYIVRDALGRIQEEYWLDTDSVETAVNVRRENLNGIAYSHNGINGPYISAWMQDGSFTTELMSTLRINAEQIIAGIITDKLNKNYWNLDTGEFSLSSNTLVDGSSSLNQTIQSVSEDNLTQEKVFNKLTQNGTKKGIQMDSSGNLYISASYINSGALTISKDGDVLFRADVDNQEVEIAAANVTGRLTASQIDATNLTVNAANITGQLTANQIDASSLKVSAANIEGTLKASQIDASSLKVSAANVTGQLTANQIDASNLKVSSANITGSITADSVAANSIIETPKIYGAILQASAGSDTEISMSAGAIVIDSGNGPTISVTRSGVQINGHSFVAINQFYYSSTTTFTDGDGNSKTISNVDHLYRTDSSVSGYQNNGAAFYAFKA